MELLGKCLLACEQYRIEKLLECIEQMKVYTSCEFTNESNIIAIKKAKEYIVECERFMENIDMGLMIFEALQEIRNEVD